MTVPVPMGDVRQVLIQCYTTSVNPPSSVRRWPGSTCCSIVEATNSRDRSPTAHAGCAGASGAGAQRRLAAAHVHDQHAQGAFQSLTAASESWRKPRAASFLLVLSTASVLSAAQPGSQTQPSSTCWIRITCADCARQLVRRSSADGRGSELQKRRQDVMGAWYLSGRCSPCNYSAARCTRLRCA